MNRIPDRAPHHVTRSFRAGRLVLAISLAAILVGTAGLGTSLAAKGDCGQPLSTGSAPTASDCGYVLKAAVGTNVCALCVCDINGSTATTTADALFCLKKAVGQQVVMSCPSCTTTTTVVQPPTTSTSTTSTTTTIPVRCSGSSDCAALPASFRCNPNTGTCETPCTKNSQCKDFYLCNNVTQYCEEPAPQF